ncbi:MAG: hypothetical protein AUK55_11555 [Syntrophobacteraceae bacterium CG2_30_61_12]|nr:MAG: hypothetical protein AUK55_11555 [Syntrophobacteraceae bacterium CG2_30_61_12]
MIKQQIGLLIREDLCVGCLACSRICPEAAIVVTDRADRREVRFQRGCRGRDCDRCVAVCPEKALALGTAEGPELEPPLIMEFELNRCRSCTRPVTTKKIVARLLERTPPQFDLGMPARDWLGLCPACRRRQESRALVQGARRDLFLPQRTAQGHGDKS